METIKQCRLTEIIRQSIEVTFVDRFSILSKRNVSH